MLALLYTRRALRRAAYFGALSFVQRLVPPALVLIVADGNTTAKVALGVAFVVLVLVQSFAGRVLQATAEADLCGRLGDAVVHGDVLAPPDRPQGSLSDLGQGIYHSAQVAALTLPVLAADAVGAVVLAGFVAAREPPAVVLVGLAVAAAGGVVLLVSRRASERAAARAWEAQTRAYRALHDVVEGRLEVAASGRRSVFVADLRHLASAWAREGVHVATRQALAGRLPLAALGALLAAVLVESGAWGITTRVRWTDAALFLSVLPPFAGLAQGTHALTRARRWVRLVTSVLAEGRAGGAERGPTAVPEERSLPSGGRSGVAPDARSAPERSSGPTPEGRRSSVGPRGSGRPPVRIDLESVSFRYPDAAEDALRGIDLSLEGPASFVLAGPNGCGKSTCLRVLLGLAQPSSGRVRVNGEPLAALDVDRWRARIAFVPQRPHLPAGSNVRGALRWLAPASDAQMLAALDRVGVLTPLERLSGSPLDAPVEALSVGQKQRIALARALCRDASIYLLDEPDANLDQAGIDLVAELVRELSRDSLVVVSAHSPALLRAADTVVRLDARGAVDTGAEIVSARGDGRG